MLFKVGQTEPYRRIELMHEEWTVNKAPTEGSFFLDLQQRPADHTRRLAEYGRQRHTSLRRPSSGGHQLWLRARKRKVVSITHGLSLWKQKWTQIANVKHSFDCYCILFGWFCVTDYNLESV